MPKSYAFLRAFATACFFRARCTGARLEHVLELELELVLVSVLVLVLVFVLVRVHVLVLVLVVQLLDPTPSCQHQRVHSGKKRLRPIGRSVPEAAETI